jgi:protein-tyrosine-phosphatase
MTIKKILFVCSGNVFRSMSVKYYLIYFCKLNKINNVSVDSAGISVNLNENQIIRKEVKDELKKGGLDVSDHQPKNVGFLDLKSYDLIVSMGYNHKKYLKDKFSVNSFLFNKICYGVNYPVYDNNDILKDYKGFKGTLYDVQILKYIKKSIPYFIKNYKKFI